MSGLSVAERLLSPKTKVMAVFGLLSALALSAAAPHWGMAWTARIVLVGFFAGMGLLALGRRKKSADPSSKRLQILSRVGLSSHCGLALVEVNGRTLLVAFGDGFAQFTDCGSGQELSEGGHAPWMQS